MIPKCAPKVKGIQGTCLTRNTITKILGNIPDNLKDEELLKRLFGKYGVKTEGEFYSRAIREHPKLLNECYRVAGPYNHEKREWLSNFDINPVLTQYEKIYPDFKYLGTWPSDFDKISETGMYNLDFDKLMKDGKYQIGVVFNRDLSTQSGSRWVALYANLSRGLIYFFDSVGMRAGSYIDNFISRIKLYCESIGIKRVITRINCTKIQFKNTECGIFSINFILTVLKSQDLDGEVLFDEVCNSIRGDDDIAKCRGVYFNKQI